MNARSSEIRLIFAWPERHHVSFKLAGFLLISFVVHASAFYLFQIVYPPVQPLLPQPARFTLLAPTDRENQLLLERIESEDPARVVLPRQVLPAQSLEIEYKPYFEQRPATLQLPEIAQTHAVYPAVESPAELVASQLPPPAISKIDAPAALTQMTVSGALKARAPQKLPPISFTTHSAMPLDRATFLFAVNDLGEVRYCFLQKSSGDTAVDDEGAAYLKSLEFNRASNGLEWGFASFQWGADLFAPPAAAANREVPSSAAGSSPLANPPTSAGDAAP